MAKSNEMDLILHKQKELNLILYESKNSKELEGTVVDTTVATPAAGVKSLIDFEGKILTLVYSPISKLLERDSLFNEELYKAEYLGNSIRVNSIALYKEWFKEIKDINEVVKIREDIESLLLLMRSVNSDGFINSNDVLKDHHYSIITKTIKRYRGNESEIPSDLKVNDREKTKLFKWCHDRISLEALLALVLLFKRTTFDFHDLKKTEDDKLIKSFTNEIANLRLAISELEGSIDSSLILSLKRKGVTFNHIRYTGFDNEYVMKDSLNNELVSIQISTNTKTLVKIPITRQYTYSKVTTLGGKFYEVYGYSDVLDNERLLRDFNILIDSYRLISYNLNDALLESIVQKLIDKGIPNIKIEDHFVFDFGRTKIKQWIKRFPKNSRFKLQDIVKISNELTANVIEKDYQRILILLKSLSYDKLEPLHRFNNNFESLTPINYYSEVEDIIEEKTSDFWDDEIKINNKMFISVRSHDESINLYNSLNMKDKDKVKSKSTLQSQIILDNLLVNINRKYQNNFIGHFNSADLSMYEDYEDYKTQLDIIKHSFITIKKAIDLDNVKLRVYDSQLLSPASKKSLKDLGSLYDIKMAKVELPDPKMIENMNILAYENWDLFKKYALQDTVIPLVHASFMEDFNFKLGCVGIPITLSNLSVSMVQYYWKEQGYKGYQILPEVKIGDAGNIQTPKVLSKLGPVGEHMSLFIENSKGGRNESFMYGIDREEEWFDYDLKGAYTTVMCLLGNPDYRRAKLLSFHSFQSMDKLNLLYSYTVIKANFKFPNDVKYPNIPVFVDKETTVYPLEGEAVMTAAEYFTAQRMGCKFEPVKIVFHIPFENLSDARKEKEVLLKDFKKYKPGIVNFSIREGKVVGFEPDESNEKDNLFEVKDLNNLKHVKTLHHLKDLIISYRFEDFRQQPNKTGDFLRFILNANTSITFKDEVVRLLHNTISEDLEIELNDLINILEIENEELGLSYNLEKFRLDVIKGSILDKFEILDLEVKRIRDYSDTNSKELEPFKFFSRFEGRVLYNLHLIKLVKLAEISVSLIRMNSNFTRKDLDFINLNNSFDIDKVYSISNKDLNLTSKNNKFEFKDIIENLKKFDDLTSEVNRCLFYKTPFNLSSSNVIGWSTDLTPRNEFGSSKKIFINAPYSNLIVYLQKERAKNPKKSILNELYKEMANSVYGQTVRGIGVKNKFDAATGDVRRMDVGKLANPIIGSWITSFVRSVIGEMLYYTDKMGGKVVSVTTDGFITNITDLESKMLDFIKGEREIYFKKYKGKTSEITSSNFLKYIIEVRSKEIESKNLLLQSKKNLFNDSSLDLKLVKSLKDEIRKIKIEVDKLIDYVKSEKKTLNSFILESETKKEKGVYKKRAEEPTLKGEDSALFEQDRTILSFSLLEEFRLTRKNISGNTEATEVKSYGTGLASWCVRGQLGLNSKISALTGYQKKGIEDKDLFNLITESMTSFDKSLDYIQTTLRSATDIYKEGGHVTRVNRDQVFRTVYDNRRVIDKPIGTPTKIHVINEGIKLEFVNVYNSLLDSKPVLNKDQCESFRTIAKTVKDSVIYNVMNRKASNSLYQDTFDIALKQFIRALYSNKLRLDSKSFKFYKDLCIWLNSFTFKGIENYIQLNPNKVALIKSRGEFINNSVPVNEETLAFVEFIKDKFPSFDEFNFLKR